MHDSRERQPIPSTDSASFPLYRQLVQLLPGREALNLLAHSLEQLCPGCTVVISGIGNQSHQLEVLAAPSLGPRLSPSLSHQLISPAGSCCAQAMYWNKTVISHNLSQDVSDAGMRRFLQGRDINACWSEPVHGNNGEVVGCLSLLAGSAAQLESISTEFVAIAASHVAMVLDCRDTDEPLAGKASTAVDQVLLHTLAETISQNYYQLALSCQRQALIARMATQMIRVPAFTVDDAVHDALAAIGQLWHVDHCLLLLQQNNSEFWHLSHSWHDRDGGASKAAYQRLGAEEVYWLYHEESAREGLFIHHPEQLPKTAGHEKQRLQQLGTQACAYIPLRNNGKLRGSLMLMVEYGDYPWTLEDRQILGIAADMFVNVITRKQCDELYSNIEDNLRQMNQLLSKEAREDGLTGLANRRYFDDQIEEEFRRSSREKQPLSLILFDIDNFKAYNDHYGHPAGDTCLTRISQTINQCFQRAADLPARYGGEEFAVIVPNASLTDVTIMAKRACQAIRDLNIEHTLSRPGRRVTASAGCATLPPGSPLSISDLIAAADAALYEAKAKGKDQVCAALPPGSVGVR